MYFAKKKNKIYLFLDGNLILSHNDTAVAANLKTACPQIHGGMLIHTLIWGPRRPLDHGKPNVPYRKPVEVEQTLRGESDHVEIP